MVGVADADPAGAMLLGFVHGDLVRLRPDDQTQAVVAVDGGDAGFLADDFDIWPGIDPAQFQHFKVSMQPRDTVGVDAAQVAPGEHVGGLLGVGSRHAEVHEDLGGEVFKIVSGEKVEFSLVCHRR